MEIRNEYVYVRCVQKERRSASVRRIIIIIPPPSTPPVVAATKIIGNNNSIGRRENGENTRYVIVRQKTNPLHQPTPPGTFLRRARTVVDIR